MRDVLGLVVNVRPAEGRTEMTISFAVTDAAELIATHPWILEGKHALISFERAPDYDDPDVKATKPPTQAINVSGTDQAKVMTPKAPPPLFVRLSKLSHNPIFQAWVAERHGEYTERSGGDSLKAATDYLQATLLSKSKGEWGKKQDEAAQGILKSFNEWAESKGYKLDE